MDAHDGKLRSERDLTDESLRVERDRGDLARAERQASVDRAADAVVERARQTADAVLLAERGLADRDAGHTPPPTRAEVALQRALADEIVVSKRGQADERMRRERAEAESALAAVLPLERGETDRYLVTERARSDSSLANRDDFLGMVSHDLRNLLGGILLSAEVLAGDASATEQGRQVALGAKRIQRYVARMNRLIGDLLDVSSIEAGKLAMTMRKGDAVALVSETVETFRPAAAEKRVTLEAQLLERKLVGFFDHERMLQVLANLTANSLKFTPPGGHVYIRAARVDDELRLCVADTGSGIPCAMIESIFERFWQIGEGQRRGVGLGLYISRQIVEAHGGKIWAESRVGEGSELHLTIPGAVAA